MTRHLVAVLLAASIWSHDPGLVAARLLVRPTAVAAETRDFATQDPDPPRADERDTESGESDARSRTAQDPDAGDPAAQEPDAGDPDTPDPNVTETAAIASSTPYRLTGWLNAKFVSRWSGGDRDNDLFTYASADLGDASEHLVTAHLSGRLNWDLDRDRDPTNRFFNVDDTRSKDITGRLYDAHADLNSVEGNPVGDVLNRVRLGRQSFYDTPVALFLDGLSIESVPAADYGDAVVTAFVGVPSHLFESSPSGDLSVGAGVSFAPWESGRLRLDYMHVTDEYLSVTTDDDLYGVRLDQSVGRSVFLGSHINFIGSDTRDFSARGSWSSTEHDLAVTARYTALFTDQNLHSIEFDFFTPIQSTYFSYDQYELTVQKGFGEHVFVDGGVQFRELRDDVNEGVFNHEFRRYYVTPGISEWPWAGTEISATFELWDSDEDRFTAIGGDLSHEFDERWTASAGTFFQLFRYDPLRGQESEDVQVSYAKLVYEATQDLELRFDFEFEHGDTADFTTLTLGARIDF